MVVSDVTFQRTDGSWGVKYVGFSTGYLFIVWDNAGSFTSPVYQYSGVDMFVNTVAAGWPQTNMYPQTLYVNGLAVPLDPTTEYNSGAALSQTGYATYHPQAGSDPSVTLSWSWQWTFQGWTVSGSVSGFPPLGGSWDGVRPSFAGLPAGLHITLNPPLTAPRQGPAQIAWNGVTLTWSPYASTENSQGADVYQDDSGLGLSATINPDGTVTFTEANGAQLVGSYDASGSTFTMDGSAAGSVYALNGQGMIVQPSGFSGGNGSVQTMDLLGNFDVRGNLLSFGNWVNGGSSEPGLMLTFTDVQGSQPALLNFGSVRQATVFGWSHAVSDASSAQNLAMQLDSSNRLLLFNPVPPSDGSTPVPVITLDPTNSGTTIIHGAVHIDPQGDIPMFGTAP